MRKGRIAIVAVILNRLITGKVEYGAENGNVMEVITYSGAFAYPKDMTDEFFLNCPEYELCMEAVEKALNGEDPTREYFSRKEHVTSIPWLNHCRKRGSETRRHRHLCNR